MVAGVAQLVEQRIRNAKVGSSNLFSGTTKILSEKDLYDTVQVLFLFFSLALTGCGVTREDQVLRAESRAGFVAEC